MNDTPEPNEPDTTGAPPPPPKPKKRRFGLWIFLVLLILLGGTGTLTHRLWQQLDQSGMLLQQKVADALTQVESMRERLHTLQQRMDSEVVERMATLHEQQKALERAMNTVYARQQKMDDEKTWSIAEILYLLNIAHQRLLLAQDTGAALAALRAADTRLAQSHDPRFIGVREQLAKDIKALREIEQPDINGMALSLSEHVRKVETLPLHQGYQNSQALADLTETAQADAKQEIKNWRDALGAVWGQLQPLVTVRYNQSGDVALLAPQQRYFLRENLHLQLENARFFLLRRDTAQFRAGLAMAQNWLHRYYDQHDKAVKVLQEDLARMHSTPLTFPLPDLSATLQALEAVAAENLTVDVPVEKPLSALSKGGEAADEKAVERSAE